MGDLIADGAMMSFDLLRGNSFTSTAKLHPIGFSLSAVERVIRDPNSKKLITRFYMALSIPNDNCTARIRSLFQMMIGMLSGQVPQVI